MTFAHHFVAGALSMSMLFTLTPSSLMAPRIEMLSPSLFAHEGMASALSASTPSEEGSRKVVVTLTGYSSTERQTDSTPFITALGTHVRDGIVAANFLRFGTRIKIPKLFGDKIFVVEDRTAPKYGDRIDIWFPEEPAAWQFGKQVAEVIVL